jgi:chloramphenicol-sensitive protein RarD
MGLMQYTNPTIQFILGLVVFQEAMSPTRFIGFALVWIALTILAVDGLRSARRMVTVAN